MADETTAVEATPTRRRGRRKGTDHRAELHTRLDRFLDNATNPASLDSLVSGLVDYELGVRLAAISNGTEVSNE